MPLAVVELQAQPRVAYRRGGGLAAHMFDLLRDYNDVYT